MRGAANLSKEREFTFDEREFRFLAKLVGEHTGIVLADHKRDMVYSRLSRRLRALGLKDFAQYCELVQGPQGDEEMGNLVNAITTNLTSFFREEHHFEHLREHVLLPRLKNPGDKRIRVWSSACSAGMEPYSIAMTMRDAMPKLEGWDAKILATDIDTNMVFKGIAGDYPISEAKDIPEPYRRFVTQDAEHIHMSDALKSLITFKPLNLLQDWPIKGPFDAVFCRNVVIYFDKDTQRKLFSGIADVIKPGGWLYIGHSENLSKVSDRFELCGRTIYRRIK